MTYIKKPKKEIVCKFCKTSFKTGNKQQIFCSLRCRNMFNLGESGRIAFINIPSGTVGAISELAVAAFFLESGYAVFRALSPSCFCDLVIIKNGLVQKIEVRTGYISSKGVLTYAKNTHGQIDAFAIYIPKTKEVRLIPYKQ